jgi:hypothetical protein
VIEKIVRRNEGRPEGAPQEISEAIELASHEWLP